MAVSVEALPVLMNIVRSYAVVFTCLLAAGCANGGSGGGSAADTLNIAEAGATNTLNPILTTQQFEVQAEAFAMDGLIETDPSGRDVPMLASRVPTLANGDIARDGVTITYHLRHGVVWQDGAPFSSRDVAFTWRAIMNPNTAVATRHGYDDIARIDTPDPYTAVFHLKHPFAPAVHTFFGPSDSPIEIVPEHLLARYRDLNNVPFNSLPVGTGPFKIVRWVRGDRIEYVANDRYFLGRPRIRRIVIHYVPDENTIVQELRAHEIDWFVQASPAVYPQLVGVAGVVPHLVPFNGYNGIIFNIDRAPFSDARLRRAVGLAVDKAALVHDITYGTAVPATEDLPSFLWAFDPNAGTTRYDLAGAKALLDDAGWHPGPDGIRSHDGRRLTLGLAYRADSLADRKLGVQITSMLKEAGIEVALKGYPTALLYAAAAGGGILSGGNFDGGLITWYAGIDPDDSSQFLCSERPPAGYNWSRECRPALDAAERTALTNYARPARKAAYAIVQTTLARDVPYVFLWWPRQIEATTSRLHGFAPNGVVESWNSYEWTLGDDRR